MCFESDVAIVDARMIWPWAMFSYYLPERRRVGGGNFFTVLPPLLELYTKLCLGLYSVVI